jgi:hypothetical protein
MMHCGDISYLKLFYSLDTLVAIGNATLPPSPGSICNAFGYPVGDGATGELCMRYNRFTAIASAFWTIGM